MYNGSWRKKSMTPRVIELLKNPNLSFRQIATRTGLDANAVSSINKTENIRPVGQRPKPSEF